VSPSQPTIYRATPSGGSAVDLTASAALMFPSGGYPQVTDVAFSGASGAQQGFLNAGDVVTLTVSFNKPVKVFAAEGATKPTLSISLGAETVSASLAAGSGNSLSNQLQFSYTIPSGKTDADGLSLAANALLLNQGLIVDSADSLAGNSVVHLAGTVTTPALAANAAYKVDTGAPAALATVLNLSQDSGASRNDRVTNVEIQQVTGNLSGSLAAGEKVQVSPDGQNWFDATSGGALWYATVVLKMDLTFFKQERLMRQETPRHKLVV